jgi:Zn-dependent protease with chaperone function
MRACCATLGFSLIVSCGMIAAQQPSAAPSSPLFTFTSVDLDLLHQTNEIDQRIDSQGSLYADPKLTEYVAAVGSDLLPQDLPDPVNVKWQFHVLREPIPNAFALPNGSIYVNTGLLAVLENEAQLASVLAHEETHVLKRHSYFENRKYRKKALTGNILSGVLGSNVPTAILEGTLYGYSRELEKEADLHAVDLVNDANYSTEEMIAALKLLDSPHEIDLSPSFYQDHPRLKDRITYVSDALGDMHAHSPHPMVEEERYFAAVEKVTRDNIPLDINEGRQRTAVATAQRLVKRDPKSADNFRALGDALGALGPRTPEPTPEELSSRGKKDERKSLWKLTPQEYEASLMASPAGKAAWEVNRKRSEDAYRKALGIDPSLAAAHRGLGFLYEKEQLPLQCSEEFQKYLELAPNAMDQAQIRRRLEASQKQNAANASAPTP